MALLCCCLAHDNTQEWEDLESVPSSARNLLRDLGQALLHLALPSTFPALTAKRLWARTDFCPVPSLIGPITKQEQQCLLMWREGKTCQQDMGCCSFSSGYRWKGRAAFWDHQELLKRKPKRQRGLRYQAFARTWLQLQPMSPVQQHSYWGQSDVRTSIKLFSGDAGCPSHILRSLDKPGLRSRIPAEQAESPSELWSPTTFTILQHSRITSSTQG